MHTAHSINELKSLSGPVAVAVGFFDGVHLGHQYLFRELKELSATLGCTPLVITFSNSPKAYHLGVDWQYLTLPDEKLYLLRASGIHAALMLDYGPDIAEMTAREFFGDIDKACGLKGIVAGYDSAVGCDMVAGEARFTSLANELGVELSMAGKRNVCGELVKSSLIRHCIRDRQLKMTATLLGRPYLIQGIVEHGKGKGAKELSIPTANIYLPDEKLAPPTGIYAAQAEVDDETYPAAICIMDRDQSQHTVLESESTLPAPDTTQCGRVVEANLIGFSGNLYGRQLRLGLVDHIRDWIDFSSAEELQKRIMEDIRIAEEMCSE